MTKRPGFIKWVAPVVVLLCVCFAESSVNAQSGGLSIREVKVTGEEFVVLENKSGLTIDDLSVYWLGYINDDASTPPPVQQLPNNSLPDGSAILLSGGGTISTCDATLVSELGSSLSDTKGTLALWQQTGSGFSYVNNDAAKLKWNKSTSSFTVSADEIDLKLETSAYLQPTWYFDSSSEKWKLADRSNCELISRTGSSSGSTVASWPENDQEPPAIIEQISSNSFAGLPASDIDLAAPQITELLPNPAGSGTDDTDEYIELYNPNDSDFDLNGFELETGLTTKHKFKFGNGTILLARSFAAYYSEDTKLTLSNSSGQAFLVDPFGKTISQSDPYKSAKDGQSWSRANGQWLWTNLPTPGKPNDINQATSTSASTPTKSGGAVNAANTSASNGVVGTTSSASSPAAVHGWTLAGVGGAALLYAGYEYKTELANNLYRARRYWQARRTAGK